MSQCTTRMQPQDVANHKGSQSDAHTVALMLQKQLKRCVWQQLKDLLSRSCARARVLELYHCYTTASGSHCQYSGTQCTVFVDSCSSQPQSISLLFLFMIDFDSLVVDKQPWNVGHLLQSMMRLLAIGAICRAAWTHTQAHISTSWWVLHTVTRKEAAQVLPLASMSQSYDPVVC